MSRLVHLALQRALFVSFRRILSHTDCYRFDTLSPVNFDITLCLSGRFDALLVNNIKPPKRKSSSRQHTDSEKKPRKMAASKEVDGSQDSASSSSIPYDYQQECFFYRVLPKDQELEEEEGERYIRLDSDDTEPPTDPEIIRKFIEDHKLEHGDVVSFSLYRAGLSFIIIRDQETKQMKWVDNPDDPGSGYLTIPQEVLKNVLDATQKYKSMLNQPSVNFHLTSRDKLIRDKYGEDVPEDWLFDVYYTLGEMDECFVKFPGQEARPINFESSTLAQLQELCAEGSADGPEAAFNVKVTLEGAKLDEYKAKVQESFPGRWGWLSASPALSRGWRLEKGASQFGPNEHVWIWKLKGPVQREQEVRQRVKDFLQGFSHEFLTSDQINIL